MPFDIRVYDTLDSTNEEARRLLEAGVLAGPAIIRAHSQTAGRGTRGRQWISPPGSGLYYSIVHPFGENIPATVPLTPLFTLAAGLACAETLVDLTDVAVQLKPVNDLYAQNGKLGGILVESIIRDNACKALITGIGLNLYTHDSLQTPLPSGDGRRNVPVSLQACMSPALFDRWQPGALSDELCGALAHAVDARYGQLIAGESAPILEAYRRYQMPGTELPEAALAAGC